MINKEVRVRYAPSPTGYIHIGNLRTALYNYLYARHAGGKFIVRIEDTDQARKVEGAVENLIATLKWAGLDYDEGPHKGGDYGPYYQSERLDIYKTHVDILLQKKKAYYCFCSAERLTTLREEQKKQKLNQTKYDKHCLPLSEDEVATNISKGMPHVVRLNVDSNSIIKFKDDVRGDVEFSGEVVDDQVLIKSDNYPTYHLANVIDDHLMKVTHVIRGEEWLPSTPKHVLLYEAFGWEVPIFAHLPLLLNPDRSKLSKRQGDVAVEDYIKKGYLKDALINFIALLGWTAGDDREVYFNIKDLIYDFTLERVNNSGAIFNIEKLNWLNAEHLRSKSESELLHMLRIEINQSKYSGNNYSDKFLRNVITSMMPRVNFIKDVIEKGKDFFDKPEIYDPNLIKKKWNEQSPEILNKYIYRISLINSPEKEDFKLAVDQTAVDVGTDSGNISSLLRLSVSGSSAGAGIFDIMNAIGKEETIYRIQTTIEKLSN